MLSLMRAFALAGCLFLAGCDEDKPNSNGSNRPDGKPAAGSHDDAKGRSHDDNTGRYNSIIVACYLALGAAFVMAWMTKDKPMRVV